MNYEMLKNDAYDSMEIYFESVPSKDVRDRLKEIGCRWHNVKKCWYSYKDEETIRCAIDGAETENNYVVEETEGYMGGGGYVGCNYRKWSCQDELKTLLIQEFKKNGIKASIRKNRGGWSYSLTITITADKKDVLVNYNGDPFDLNQYHLDRENRFTEAFKNKLILANDIIRSFNRDDSNPMVDYFYVGFYYSIHVKC